LLPVWHACKSYLTIRGDAGAHGQMGTAVSWKTVKTVVTVLTGVVGLFWSVLQIKEKCGARSLQQCFSDMWNGKTSGLEFKPCAVGSRVRPEPDSYHIRIIAVENSPRLNTLLDKSLDHGQHVIEALRKRDVTRVSTPSTLTLYIRGITAHPVPDRVPLLADGSVCRGDVVLKKIADGALLAVSPLSDGNHSGDVTVILPRAVLHTSRAAQTCIEPTFTLLNATEKRQNEYCDYPGGTGLHESAVAGAGGRVYVLVRDGSARAPKL
jgi:hypothetical protein